MKPEIKFEANLTYAARSTTMILTYLFCDCEHVVNVVYTISFQSYYACVSSSCAGYMCFVNALLTEELHTACYATSTAVHQLLPLEMQAYCRQEDLTNKLPIR